jgi:hypothetical protein
MVARHRRVRKREAMKSAQNPVVDQVKSEVEEAACLACQAGPGPRM